VITKQPIEESILVILSIKQRLSTSFEEELDNSMKTEDLRTFEHGGRVLVTSFSSFTILTTKPIILGINMVS
jgi:hypothetical protein